MNTHLFCLVGNGSSREFLSVGSIGECPDCKELSVMLGGCLLDDEAEDTSFAVVAIQLPLSLPLQSNTEVFRLPIKGSVKDRLDVQSVLI